MTQPQRNLRFFDATTLVVGSMIGSSIFIGLSIMAEWVQTPGILLGLWAFGGLFTIMGATAYAELAAMLPKAGGQYVFLREAFSDFWAFLFGWTQFLVVQTGFNAAVALAFANPRDRGRRRASRRPSGGGRSVRQGRLDAGHRRHPRFHVRLRERYDPRRRPGVLRDEPRRAFFPPLRPPASQDGHARDGAGLSGGLVNGPRADRFIFRTFDLLHFCLGVFFAA